MINPTFSLGIYTFANIRAFLENRDAFRRAMPKTAASDGAWSIATRAIAIGILANCLLKAARAAALGTSQFWRLTKVAARRLALAIVVSVAALH